MMRARTHTLQTWPTEFRKKTRHRSGCLPSFSAQKQFGALVTYKYHPLKSQNAQFYCTQQSSSDRVPDAPPPLLYPPPPTRSSPYLINKGKFANTPKRKSTLVDGAASPLPLSHPDPSRASCNREHTLSPLGGGGFAPPAGVLTIVFPHATRARVYRPS